MTTRSLRAGTGLPKEALRALKNVTPPGAVRQGKTRGHEVAKQRLKPTFSCAASGRGWLLASKQRPPEDKPRRACEREPEGPVARSCPEFAVVLSSPSECYRLEN